MGCGSPCARPCCEPSRSSRYRRVFGPQLLAGTEGLGGHGFGGGRRCGNSQAANGIDGANGQDSREESHGQGSVPVRGRIGVVVNFAALRVSGESNVVAHCWVRYSRLNGVWSIQHPGRLDRPIRSGSSTSS